LSEEELSIYGITTILENAKNFEKDIEKLIVNQLKNHALYAQYLSKITGIRPLIAAGLISYIDDIEKFDHVSSLWQYSGYGMNRYCENCKKPTFVEVKYETGNTAKKLHPLDLKNAVAREISNLLKPIQKKGKELEKLSEKAYN